LARTLLEVGKQRPHFGELRSESLDAAKLGGDLGQRARGVGVQSPKSSLARFQLSAQRSLPSLGLFLQGAQLGLRRGPVEHFLEAIDEGEIQLGHGRRAKPFRCRPSLLSVLKRPPVSAESTFMSTTQDVSVGGNLGLSTRGLGHAAARAATLLVCAVLPALLVVVIVGGSAHDHFAFDFHQFWQGGHDVVNGHSPYPDADSLPTRGGASLDPTEIQRVFRFPYPAPAALAMAPLGLLPFTLAAWIFVLGSVGAVFVALRLLGVVDWRCYGIAFASMTTLGALRLGTFTPLLLLGLALAWRHRDNRLAAAATVGCVIVAKIFLWPLLIWLVLTRRVATAALAVLVAAVITAGSWAVLGFAGLGDYPKLLSSLAGAVQGKGWSTVALGLSLGLSTGVAKALAWALGCLALAGARFGPRRKRDLWVFALAIAAAILFSPIVWLHYFLLLAAPLAIAYPRLAPAWLLPFVFWVWPFQETGGNTWKIALGLVLLIAVTTTVLRASPRPRAT
jgi:hypothetical protein